MVLHLDCITFKISDGKGREVSLDNAKAFWLDGKVEDCNQGFQRLANMDFNIKKLDEFYKYTDKSSFESK